MASAAFALPEPAVDGNVLRVVTRLADWGADIADVKTKRAVREALRPAVPDRAEDIRVFNQALMELGAVVCLPNGAPLCEQCPVRELCAAHLEERTAELPVKAAKKKRRIEERRVWLIFRNGRVALRRRPSKGLLAGLWEYPNELADDKDWLERWHIPAVSRENAGTGKHIFTHVEWHMTAEAVCSGVDDLPEGWIWAGARELEQVYAVPNAFQSCRPTVLERLEKWSVTT